jgi:hypothetical protein
VAPISPETFLQNSGGTEVDSQLRASDMLLAPLAGWFYQGPYDGALADVQGPYFTICWVPWHFDTRQ